ncbi:MAG: hypothetical protein A2428_01555 [Bdellovibrionales bacterium RIFOXYC1_FULL_54_43]|nr:MAG: hypothetical protein A2428_01555 [Bdellovibrionales bacterium RIFOXYC1_FULL_54_43]
MIRKKPLTCTSIALLGTLAAIALNGCSMNFVPIHYSRVNSAKSAAKPLERGPNAPGAFKHVFQFSAGTGYRFDPAQVDFSGGVVRLKRHPGPSGRFPSGRIFFETNSGVQFAALDGFAEVLGPANKGLTRYQISNDGSNWYYFHESRWKAATANPVHANSADEINAKIGHFHTEVGSGSLFVRAFLISKGSDPVEIRELQVLGIAPQTDGWD